MARSKRRSSDFNKDPKMKGNFIVIGVVLLIFALGLGLMIRGCSADGGSSPVATG